MHSATVVVNTPCGLFFISKEQALYYLFTILIFQETMFKKISHANGMETDEAEILFSTPFNYLFPDAARSVPCLLLHSNNTVTGLQALGEAMADDGPAGTTVDPDDSNIPAIFTYLGQFIDHDITARTDRDEALTSIENPAAVQPLSPDTVTRVLRNGRRPQLDLDSVFGEGPAMVPGVTTQSQILYDSNFKLKVFEAPGRIDLIREAGTRTAIIADGRNDENLNISQLHARILKFYNHIYDNQDNNLSAREKYARARQLTRWAYQFVVLNDFLMTVCDPNVVRDTLANGPRFYGFTAGQGDTYMPLEFSVAGFRFGHSLIRPSYKLNANTTVPLKVMPPGAPQLLAPASRADNFAPDGQLKADFVIEWSNFIGANAQKTRKIETRIARGLFNLPFRPQPPILSHLATSNLVRGFNLSIPTGQAVCDVMGIIPLTPAELKAGESALINTVLSNPAYQFDTRSPLWYYILREAAVQQNGARLGEVGSRIVAETLVGLVKQDPNSYLNNQHDPAVNSGYIQVGPGGPGKISSLAMLLSYAGANFVM